MGEIIRSVVGESSASHTGFYRYCQPLKDQLVEKMLIDSSTIDPTQKIPVAVPCWRRHPGLCATKCKSFWGEIADLSTKLGQLLPKASHAKMFRIRCSRSDGSCKSFVGVLAFVRLRNPVLHVLLKCSLDKKNNIITPRALTDGRPWCLTTAMIVRSFLQDCDKLAKPVVTGFTLTELAIDFSKAGITFLSEGAAVDVLRHVSCKEDEPQLSEAMQRWHERMMRGLDALKPTKLHAAQWKEWEDEDQSDCDRDDLLVAEYSTKLLEEALIPKACGLCQNSFVLCWCPPSSSIPPCS